MALEDLIIFQKVYDFTLWMYPAVNKFPKHQRFVLGQRVETTLLTILEEVIQANQSRNKQPHLWRASVELDKLRALIRLSKDLKFISVRQYGFAAERVNEIGKLLGGWARQTGNSRQAPGLEEGQSRGLF